MTTSSSPVEKTRTQERELGHPAISGRATVWTGGYLTSALRPITVSSEVEILGDKFEEITAKTVFL